MNLSVLCDAGLGLLLGLYLVYALFLPVYEISALLLLAVPLWYLGRSASTKGDALHNIVPFLFVLCAAQLDPARAILKNAAVHPATALHYQVAVLCLVALASSANIFGVWRSGRAAARRRDKADRWVLGTGMSAAVFYALFNTVFRQDAGPLTGSLPVIGLLAGYPLLFVTVKDRMGGRWEKTLVRAFLVLLSVAALSGTVRLYAAIHHYKVAAGAISDGRLDEAVASLDMALKLNDRLGIDKFEARILSRKAGAVLQAGDTGGALALAGRSKELDARYAPAYEIEADAFYAQGLLIEAVDSYELARSLSPDVTSYYPRLAIAYARTGQWHRGAYLAGYGGDLSGDAKDPGDYVSLAMAMNRWGRHREAESLADKALSVRPGSYRALTQLGVARERLGAVDDALGDFKRAVELAPDKAIEASGRLEKLYEGLGLKDEAAAARDAGLAMETGTLALDGSRRTGTVFFKSEGYTAFHTNGMATVGAKLYKGSHVLTVVAKGQPARGVYPEMTVLADDEVIGKVTVDSREWREYDFEFYTRESAEYGLTLEYTNDEYFSREENRNLYVKVASVRRTEVE